MIGCRADASQMISSLEANLQTILYACFIRFKPTMRCKFHAFVLFCQCLQPGPTHWCNSCGVDLLTQLLCLQKLVNTARFGKHCDIARPKSLQALQSQSNCILCEHDCAPWRYRAELCCLCWQHALTLSSSSTSIQRAA